MTVFKCVVSYFKEHKLIFGLILVTIISVTLLSLLPPQLLRIIIDDILIEKKEDKLLTFSLLYAFSYIFIGIIDFIKEVLLIIISQGISKKIRLNMLHKVNRMTYFDFINYSSGELEAYFSNDVEEINSLITSGVISMTIDCLKIIGIIVSIFVYSYIFGLMTLAFIPLILLFTLFVRKRMFLAQSQNRKLEGSVNSQILENIDNINTIKSYRIYSTVEKKYENILLKHYSSNQKANFYDAIFSPIVQVLKTLIIVLIIMLANVQDNVFNMSVGMIASSIDLITDLFKPIESLGMELQSIQKSMAAIRRINVFFKINEDEIKDQSLDSSNEFVLKFDDVSFSYDGKENVIEHFNYTLTDKERLTLKGRSGSGKSTLFKLAYGLIKPTKGRVTINGIDTYKLCDESKRKIFGIVYQEYYFSNGTIKDEITLYDSTITDERVYEVLKLVGLDRIKDINVILKPTDYSSGELSLFNIARAIINETKILFLDEMNAKVDSITAKKIISVIDEISKDKIVLSINHYGDLLSESKILNLQELNNS